MNVTTFDLPTLLAAAGVPPSWQHSVIRLTCAFLRKTGQGCSKIPLIFAESLEVLVMALEALHEEAKPLGLKVSWLKTKVQEVQYHEVKEVNHSNIIIPLFSSAISQFKKYRCPRIKRHLMVQMAEEYHQGNDSSKALTLLNHVMWDYRSEKWWGLLQSASVLGLQCAFNTAAITEYFGLALEYMGKSCLLQMKKRREYIAIFQGYLMVWPQNLSQEPLLKPEQQQQRHGQLC
ncbi:Trafficking protein particle complex subunit 11 [Chionoecetes opilio]|uniref:Trafficking protein particle complex subunit 11 n=1 Tax=Chionoecetes opilio TaxID=41210 RepID=A0A8J4YQP5_CHIOP|nr:Trafficking protein particle complex subunit 11 [Chionoecetes opilio]